MPLHLLATAELPKPTMLAAPLDTAAHAASFDSDDKFVKATPASRAAFTPSCRSGAPEPQRLALARQCLHPDAWPTIFERACEATHPLFGGRVATDFAQDYVQALRQEHFFERLAEETAKVYALDTLRDLASSDATDIGAARSSCIACETGVAIGLAKLAGAELSAADAAPAMHLLKAIFPTQASGPQHAAGVNAEPIDPGHYKQAQRCVKALHPELDAKQRAAACEAVAATASPSDLNRVKAFFESDLGRRWLRGRPFLQRWMREAMNEAELYEARMAAYSVRITGYALEAARRNPPDPTIEAAREAELQSLQENLKGLSKALESRDI